MHHLQVWCRAAAARDGDVVVEAAVVVAEALAAGGVLEYQVQGVGVLGDLGGEGRRERGAEESAGLREAGVGAERGVGTPTSRAGARPSEGS